MNISNLFFSYPLLQLQKIQGYTDLFEADCPDP